MSGCQILKKRGAGKGIFIHSFAKLAMSILFVVVLSFTGIADAATYYVSPSGSDVSVGTGSAPWATFSKAMKKLRPGDTLIVKDGTYNQTLNITVSGTSGSPVTVKADHDGGAVIDGQNVRMPCSITGSRSGYKHDITIEGIKCQNSSTDVFTINYADNITLRRVSAYNAAIGNYHAFSVSATADSLLEDCAASGFGRIMYLVMNSHGVTLRRCWGRWIDASQSPYMVINIYGSDDTIAENCVGTMDTSSSKPVRGITIWAHTYNDSADNNKVYGNVMYNFVNYYTYTVESASHNITGNQFLNNIGINGKYGFFQRADDALTVNNLTLIGTDYQNYQVLPDMSWTKDADFKIKGDVRNSLFVSGTQGFNVNSAYLTSFTNAYNNLYGVTTPYLNLTKRGIGEKTYKPGFNVTKYGKGAYLFIPEGLPLKKAGEGGSRIGAEVLYRYENMNLTNEPLWPWPMEDRIYKETGISVTWESKGGLWKTLDGVYDKRK